MKFTKLAAKALAVALVFATAPVSATAQSGGTHTVQFVSGANHATITGAITGDEGASYIVNARAGQTLIVDFAPSNPRANFNINPPGGGEAIAMGEFEHASVILPKDGNYEVLVYLVRAAARRGEQSNFTMTITIPAGGSTSTAPASDYADGMAGGPDFWEVTGVSSGDALSLRAGPSTQDRIVDKLSNGTVLRNFGCGVHGSTTWCQVQTTSGAVIDGWVASRYLRESGGPRAIAGSTNVPELVDMGDGTYSVNFASGCSQQYDRAGARISSDGPCSDDEFIAGRTAIDAFRAEQGL